MEKHKIYTKKEINNLCKKINKMFIIGMDGISPEEKFKQLKIDGVYVPYLISSYGRIFSINYKHKKNSCIQLKSSIDKYGYEFIVIHYDNKIRGFNVHRLVALMFISNDDNRKTQVNHKDGCKVNNVVYNLEWTTPKENIVHALINNLSHPYGEDNGNNIYSEKDIKKVCKLLEKDYSLYDISKKTNVSYAMISLIYRRKNWTNISKDYNFDNYTYGRSRKYHVFEICELLQNTDKSISKIADICNVKESKVRDILRGHSYKSISSSYDFSNRISKI